MNIVNPSGPRANERGWGKLRPLSLQRRYTCHAEGSVLVSMGQTRVLCTASVDHNLPHFIRNKGQSGWVTSEYGMLPRATHTRGAREATRGKQSGRTQEIQRLIGRSMRAAVNLNALCDHQILIDCDVLQADGGTRCASINGAWVALADACAWLVEQGRVRSNPLKNQVAAVSVGMLDGQALLDLDYEEDSNCATDLNVVMLQNGGLVEVQGTAEGAPFSRSELNNMLDLAEAGIREIYTAQSATLA